MTHPDVEDPNKVGTYPAFVKSGGGYFYDEVLEYRVWLHPEDGAEDLHDGDDYFHAFATYDDALAFSKTHTGAEPPCVLVLQREYIDEPEPGRYERKKGKRIAEWQPEWLDGRKRERDSIADFFAEHAK